MSNLYPHPRRHSRMGHTDNAHRTRNPNQKSCRRFRLHNGNDPVILRHQFMTLQLTVPVNDIIKFIRMEFFRLQSPPGRTVRSRFRSRRFRSDLRYFRFRSGILGSRLRHSTLLTRRSAGHTRHPVIHIHSFQRGFCLLLPFRLTRSAARRASPILRFRPVHLIPDLIH